jgi:hypothetical protein
MAGHPPLREGGGPGPQLPGRLHQPRQCPQGGQDIRQVPAVMGQVQKGRIPRLFCSMPASSASKYRRTLPYQLKIEKKD